jgi:hypothetical protein
MWGDKKIPSAGGFEPPVRRDTFLGKVSNFLG